MEDKSEINPQELNIKNYETFLYKCRQHAVRLVATEAPKDSIRLISNTWDDFQPKFTPIEEDMVKVVDLWKNRLHELGVETIPENPRDLNDLSLTALAYEYVGCKTILNEQPDLIDEAVREKNDLEERIENLNFGPFNQAHPFFQKVYRLRDGLDDYINIMDRRSAEINLPNGAIKRAEKQREMADRIKQYQAALFSSLTLEKDTRENANYVKENLELMSSIVLPIALSITDTAKEDEATTELDILINGILNGWLENEGEFLNIEKAPKDMQKVLYAFMAGNADITPFPHGIIGKPLDDLISDHVDPDERNYFMYLYSLRALMNQENDEYLEMLYKEKYEKKNK